MKPDPRETYDRPLDVEVHGDVVVITGPGPAAIALTGQAAATSAGRLAAAARRASRRNVEALVPLRDS